VKLVDDLWDVPSWNIVEHSRGTITTRRLTLRCSGAHSDALPEFARLPGRTASQVKKEMVAVVIVMFIPCPLCNREINIYSFPLHVYSSCCVN
jgi:hypothetical protein